MRKIPILPGQYHHIYNRGVNHATIFFTRANWLFFLRRLRHYCPPERGDVIAYCLMPNHYHLLIQAHCADFGVQVMQPLTVSYTKAINKQEGRSGHLFEGPFHNRLVSSAADLANLTRYIHLNPVAAGFVDRPEAWDFSSYQEYTGRRPGTLPRPAPVLDTFASPEAYGDFVCGSADPAAGLAAELLLD
jgi:REP element-mobilizing transposase RayT